MPWPRVDFHAGPFQGMRYINRPQDWDHTYLYHAQDAFPTPDGAYAPRAADVAMAPTTVSASATVQGEAVFRTSDGTVRDILAINGELWRRSAGDLTKDVSTTNLTSATITLNASGRIHFATFNDTLVVTDGTNTPFTWDGTVSAGLTSLTNAPVAFGPAAVYYAKLFFVKNTERDTIVWSEELAANTGYEAGGFNNAWSLRQSGSGPIHRILGRNEALYYFRQRSIGSIRGAVTTDFSAAGVHADISEQVGTTAPESVLDYEGYIWFVDAQGRPWRFAPGGRLEPVWHNVSALFAASGTDATPGGTGARSLALQPADVALTLAAPFHHHRAVVFGWTPSGAAHYTHLYAFDAESGEPRSRITTKAATINAAHIGTGVLSSTIDYPVLNVAGLSSTAVNIVSFGSPSAPYASGTNPVYVTGPFAAPSGKTLHSLKLTTRIVIGPGGATEFVSVKATAVPLGHLGDAASAISGTAILSARASSPSERVAVWGLGREARWQQFQLSVENDSGGVPLLTGIDLEAAVMPLPATVTS